MKIVSTNIAKPTFFLWNGKQEKTGINKTPVDKPIHLGKEEVQGDEVTNRKYHGGIYKACYLFSADHYPYWKNLYPDMDWDWGMFGENLTVEGLNESEICIGDIYKIGTALVQITQPREPCYKLGVKFGSQRILKQFIEHGRPGTYIKVLEEGNVSAGDSMTLVESPKNKLTTAQFFRLLFAKEKDREILDLALNNKALPERKREKLQAFVK